MVQHVIQITSCNFLIILVLKKELELAYLAFPHYLLSSLSGDKESGGTEQPKDHVAVWSWWQGGLL